MSANTKYQVTIHERLCRSVWVEAPDAEAAEDAVRELYRECEIVLDDPTDYLDTAFDVCEERDPNAPATDYIIKDGKAVAA